MKGGREEVAIVGISGSPLKMNTNEWKWICDGLGDGWNDPPGGIH